MADLVIVPDLVGQPVHIARDVAAKVGLGLASGDPDGPGIGSRTWPGLFWVTAQEPSADSFVEWGSQIQVEFEQEGNATGDVPVGAGV